MVYLVVVVVAALVGTTRLWLIQRRQRNHLVTVDGFWESLEKISSDRPPIRLPAPRMAPRMRTGSVRPVRGPAPLDPIRRDAARRRIAARRAARSRATRSRAAS
ncbi:MAG: hypothetical protein ACRDJI_06795 [Actinomycetota bacterium]